MRPQVPEEHFAYEGVATVNEWHELERFGFVMDNGLVTHVGMIAPCRPSTATAPDERAVARTSRPLRPAAGSATRSRSCPPSVLGQDRSGSRPS